MDAKSKANFINSVAAGASVTCPKCSTANKSDSKYCISCGTDLSAPRNAQNSTPAFEQVKEPKSPENASNYVEPKSVFAEGLPEWTLEPPQVMVRRH